MHFISTTKKAFTMLEVVFVIVILGIVSSIGAEVIAKVYESYHMQRASYRSSIKIELATTQIANRLNYAIPSTLIGRVSETTPAFTSAEGMDDVNDTFQYEVLQWIGYDSDSFGAKPTPGWSGFADVRASTQTKISSPGSDLSTTNLIIANLSKGDTKSVSSAVLFFPTEYDTTVIGYAGSTQSSGVHKISSASGEDIPLANSLVGKTIHEHYKLAWSSYAIVPTNKQTASDGKELYDLVLRYNFQPWNGSNYTTSNSQLLIQNVSLFQFQASATTIRFKLCQREYITNDFFINTCKEKAVIR